MHINHKIENNYADKKYVNILKENLAYQLKRYKTNLNSFRKYQNALIKKNIKDSKIIL